MTFRTTHCFNKLQIWYFDDTLSSIKVVFVEPYAMSYIKFVILARTQPGPVGLNVEVYGCSETRMYKMVLICVNIRQVKSRSWVNKNACHLLFTLNVF